MVRDLSILQRSRFRGSLGCWRFGIERPMPFGSLIPQRHRHPRHRFYKNLHQAIQLWWKIFHGLLDHLKAVQKTGEHHGHPDVLA